MVDIAPPSTVMTDVTGVGVHVDVGADAWEAEGIGEEVDVVSGAITGTGVVDVLDAVGVVDVLDVVGVVDVAGGVTDEALVVVST